MIGEIISPFACVAIAGLVAFAAGGSAVGALIARPFAEQQAEGRRLAYMSFACAIIAALLCLYAGSGTNNPERVYVIGAIPLGLSVIALIVYSRR